MARILSQSEQQLPHQQAVLRLVELLYQEKDVLFLKELKKALHKKDPCWLSQITFTTSDLDESFKSKLISLLNLMERTQQGRSKTLAIQGAIQPKPASH